MEVKRLELHKEKTELIYRALGRWLFLDKYLNDIGIQAIDSLRIKLRQAPVSEIGVFYPENNKRYRRYPDGHNMELKILELSNEEIDLICRAIFTMEYYDRYINERAKKALETIKEKMTIARDLEADCEEYDDDD
ncbi:hypothetical protein DP113_15885 [Brasilonema octagenarum UFV-E1]|uniref:Uncharacterized protein n=2 Tax=Brasilonema TaxID=383614 RepID=A0A856MEW7_9CYAN|nr:MULTISPECIES: hypothetical protein [Brasilonema]NMF66949.1 hypothetical protein [Brasilonema octagenarum UFV-OR1]QDL09192.1 hypothetical protein DP114_15950 [Brasilonema sennae CENA114]QDL15550.1 hypothetical protein DP113_15885 [Brasilonema octagenarum UFV-E1]